MRSINDSQCQCHMCSHECEYSWVNMIWTQCSDCSRWLHSGAHSVQAAAAGHEVLTSLMEASKALALESLSSSELVTWWIYWPFGHVFCPCLGGARTQHSISPPSPSSQGRPRVLVHKMDFILSHHLCTGVRGGRGQIIDTMALWKTFPFERTRSKTELLGQTQEMKVSTGMASLPSRPVDDVKEELGEWPWREKKRQTEHGD